MGSMTSFSSLGRFVEAFGDKIANHFQYLVGAKVIKMTNKEVSYHVKAMVTLAKEGGFEESFEVHHRWATPEEDVKHEEIGHYTMENYFEDLVKGFQIERVYVGTSDRDDEVYLFAVVNDIAYLEIPVGLDPKRGVISGIAKELLTKTVIEDFFAQSIA